MRYILLAVGSLLITNVWAQTKITSEEAYKALNKKKNKIQLVDVRTAKEYDTKHIDKSVNIDWNQKENFAAETAKLNKKKPVYIYCQSGGRSVKAAKQLAEQGFEVFEIEGGVLKWQSNDLPLVLQKSELEQLTKQDFEKLVNSHTTVLVDFYAEWCGPCKKMDPVISKIAKTYEKDLKVIKINTDQNSNLVKKLKITSIPQFFIYKNGKLTWSQKGIVDQHTIDTALGLK